MKKIIIFFILLTFVACTSIPKESWNNAKNLETDSLQLQSGDILLNRKSFLHITRFLGHSAIYMNDDYVAEAYMIFGKVRKVKFDKWVKKNANKYFLVLRLNDQPEAFRKKLMEKLDSEIGKPYVLFTSKMGTRGFYCSQFVWQMYYETAEELGIKLDLDINDGYFVFPYDLYNPKFLQLVPLK